MVYWFPAIIGALSFLAVSLLMANVSMSGWQLFLATIFLSIIYFGTLFWYLLKGE